MKKATVFFMAILTMFMMSCGGNGGSKASGEAENKDKLPDGFPTDVYIVKGSVDHVIPISFGGKEQITVYMTSKLTPEEIRTDIVKNMETNGWTTDTNTESQLYFSKDGRSVRVGIIKDGDNTSINYTVSE